MTVIAEAYLQPVAAGVYAWIGAGGDSNAGAIETPSGLLVIDAQQHEALARRFRTALAAQVGRPLRQLINTHYHVDHVAGNVVFADDLPIIAHERTLRTFETLLGPRSAEGWTVRDLPTKAAMFYGENIQQLVPETDPAWSWFKQRFDRPEYDTIVIRPPTETFADQYAYHLPNDRVRLDYAGPAHCDGDVVVHAEKKKVIFLGDLFFHGRFPWLGDCDLDGWIRTLDRVLRLDVDVVVPGHGVPTTLKELAQFRDLLRARDATAVAVRAGASEEAAAREVVLPQYATMPRYAEWMPFNVRSTYRYLAVGR